jgi:hypothetical protein
MIATSALLAVLAAVAPPDTAAPVTIHFADGSQVPLLDWVLSYEFLTGQPGALPSSSLRRDVHELRLGGKSWPATGIRIEIEYQTVVRERDAADGSVIKENVPRASEVTVTHEGKKSKVRPQAPDHKFLIGGERSLNVLPRTLDLRGQTLTGTKREVCLLTFSDLADCGGSDDSRVVKVEFP